MPANQGVKGAYLLPVEYFHAVRQGNAAENGLVLPKERALLWTEPGQSGSGISPAGNIAKIKAVPLVPICLQAFFKVWEAIFHDVGCGDDVRIFRSTMAIAHWPQTFVGDEVEEAEGALVEWQDGLGLILLVKEYDDKKGEASGHEGIPGGEPFPGQKDGVARRKPNQLIPAGGMGSQFVKGGKKAGVKLHDGW